MFKIVTVTKKVMQVEQHKVHLLIDILRDAEANGTSKEIEIGRNTSFQVVLVEPQSRPFKRCKD